MDLWVFGSNLKKPDMKKIIYLFSIFSSIVLMASCDYDDSNDIDILKPIDSTETSIEIRELPTNKPSENSPF